MNEPLDVLVVGAGPVGLAVACLLTRLGLRIAVIEKRSEPSQHSKAIGLQYRVSETLARMGLIDESLKRGGNPTSVNIYAGNDRRRQEAIEFRGKTYPLAFLMADVHLSGPLPHGENHVWLHPDGSLAALPLPELNTWRLFVEISRQPPRKAGEWTVEDVQRFMAARSAGVDSQIVGDPLWLSEFRINCRMVDRMHQGRAFLAGDSAHIHSPTGGQGITTGIQDAVNLAWKLARVCRGAPRELLDTYDEERLPQGAEVVQETDRTTNVFFAPTRTLRTLRDWIVLPLLRTTWVQRRMFGKLSQLHTNYRESSLSQNQVRFGSRAIRAGDRAPDVAFVDLPSSNRTTLFELMRTFRPIVLFGQVENGASLIDRLQRLDVDAYSVTSNKAPSATFNSTLVDVHGDFRRFYGLAGNFMCLIRPDGHLGFVSVPASTAGLVRYLERITDAEAVRNAFDAV